MAFDQTTVQKIQAWTKTKQIVCPCCKTGNWEAPSSLSGLVEVPHPPPPFLNLVTYTGANLTAFLAWTCRGCGYTFLVNAKDVGL
jgi:hypothetical protein